MSTLSAHTPLTSSGAPSRSAYEGTFSIEMRSALPLWHSAVTGSCIGSMPASSSTVATQIEFEPDMGGVSSGSMMMKPICSLGSFRD
jgi:hypothetical protein